MMIRYIYVLLKAKIVKACNLVIADLSYSSLTFTTEVAAGWAKLSEETSCFAMSALESLHGWGVSKLTPAVEPVSKLR